MEVKSSSPKRLSDLPASTDEFWAEAEVHTCTVHGWMEDHLHFFNRVTGHQAYCGGCGWGFELDPGDKIKEGHLYTKKGKLVI